VPVGATKRDSTRWFVGTALPRYPVYVPTKGRYESALTIKFLLADRTPFRAVVEPSEVEHYLPLVGEERLLVLPRDNMKLIGSRNWIKQHSIDEGHTRHWQLDDNIRRMWRQYDGKRIRCQAGPALAVVEDLSDRYENVAISGMTYEMFGWGFRPPVTLNAHVYSCTLINNEIPHGWRLVYNDDTDICLQVLADGWCTLLVNAFMAEKMRTMQVRGGNTGIYQGDGRLAMARQLARVWPGVVKIDRRYGRPQHVIDWRRFRTQLVPRVNVDPEILNRDYGLRLVGDPELVT